MKSYNLVFSREPAYRLYRHCIFWIAFLFYFFYVNLLPAKPQDLFLSKTYIQSLQLMIYAPINFIAVYIALQFILPLFISKGRYPAFFAILIGLTIVYFAMAFGVTYLFARLTQAVPYRQLPISFRWFLPVRYGIGFPVTSTVLVCILKLFSDYQAEQKENERLLKRKITTELQLLKTRFQPQFLYNTLQNILTLFKQQPNESRSTLLHLSELLSYILYENEREKVPLERELEIIKSFLILKKNFYPETLNIQFSEQMNTTGLMISPLVLLSVLENILDDSESEKMQINLDVKSLGNILYFQLERRKESSGVIVDTDLSPKLTGFIRRIELLYNDKYSVDLFKENGTEYLLITLELSEPLSEMKTITALAS